MESPFANTLKGLPSMHVATYERLLVENIVDYHFWETLRKRVDGVSGVPSFSTLNMMGDILQRLSSIRKSVFQRRMTKTLLLRNGLQDLNPLEFIIVQLAARYQRTWTNHKRPLLPELIHAVYDDNIDGQYATQFILKLFCKTSEEEMRLVCDDTTIPFLIETQDEPFDWVLAGLTWEKSGIFQWQSESYVQYLPYVDEKC